MRNFGGRIVYVGKSKNLRRRLRDYFTPSRMCTKTKAMMTAVADFEIQITKTEKSATLLEESLILKFLPKYNLAQREGLPRHWIAVDRSSGSPRLCIRKSKFLGVSEDSYGPYPSRAIACWLLLFVTKMYDLRSDPELALGEEITAPNAESGIGDREPLHSRKISGKNSSKRLEAACSWLSLPRWRVVGLLSEHMLNLAASRKFEEAATCRDVIKSLGNRPPRRPVSSMLVKGDLAAFQSEELRLVLKLPSPIRSIEAFDISHFGRTGNVASVVVMRGGLPCTREYQCFDLSIGGINDVACIRQAVLWRYANRPLPDLIVVDGGMQQLRAALSSLQKISKKPKCLISLAKVRETIFKHDGAILQLSLASPALHLVQRIRDEAHRAANSNTRHRYRKLMRGPTSPQSSPPPPPA